jgi:chromosome segregation ATPase
LKEKVKRMDEEVKRARDTEKKCRLLEETIKARNPNSIPMMLQAVRDTDGHEELAVMKARVKEVELLMDEKDKEYERKLRTLRQEAERLKEHYEAKKVATNEAKKIKELEQEIETLKTYYNKRIREVEDKAKVTKPGTSDNSKLIQQFEEQIEKLTKERNLLAQKVVNLETQNNKRRQSFSGALPSGM